MARGSRRQSIQPNQEKILVSISQSDVCRARDNSLFGQPRMWSNRTQGYLNIVTMQAKFVILILFLSVNQISSSDLLSNNSRQKKLESNLLGKNNAQDHIFDVETTNLSDIYNRVYLKQLTAWLIDELARCHYAVDEHQDNQKTAVKILPQLHRNKRDTNTSSNKSDIELLDSSKLSVMKSINPNENLTHMKLTASPKFRGQMARTARRQSVISSPAGVSDSKSIVDSSPEDIDGETQAEAPPEDPSSGESELNRNNLSAYEEINKKAAESSNENNIEHQTMNHPIDNIASQEEYLKSVKAKQRRNSRHRKKSGNLLANEPKLSYTESPVPAPEPIHIEGDPLKNHLESIVGLAGESDDRMNDISSAQVVDQPNTDARFTIGSKLSDSIKNNYSPRERQQLISLLKNYELDYLNEKKINSLQHPKYDDPVTFEHKPQSMHITNEPLDLSHLDRESMKGTLAPYAQQQTIDRFGPANFSSRFSSIDYIQPAALKPSIGRLTLHNGHIYDMNQPIVGRKIPKNLSPDQNRIWNSVARNPQRLSSLKLKPSASRTHANIVSVSPQNVVQESGTQTIDSYDQTPSLTHQFVPNLATQNSGPYGIFKFPGQTKHSNPNGQPQVAPILRADGSTSDAGINGWPTLMSSPYGQVSATPSGPFMIPALQTLGTISGANTHQSVVFAQNPNSRYAVRSFQPLASKRQMSSPIAYGHLRALSSKASGSSRDELNGSMSSSSSSAGSEPQWSESQNQEDEYQQSPQTIQITAVPNGLNAWNGLNNVGFNGLNGFNGWNGGWNGWNGRQVLLVNRQPQVGSSGEWRQWVLPVAAILALPLILGALFVPVFLKSVLFLIQILQMLGLLMPPSQVAGHLAASAHSNPSG